jgi:cell division initiation protein
MKLTPLDIRHKEFKRGMRGYADVEVDEFLDQIADEYERLFKENIDLQERVEALEDKVAGYRRIEETLQKTLINAQASAEELKQNATKESQLILQDAELKARQMVNEAYSERQAIEQNMAKLRNAEEDFRYRFKTLLEGYMRQLQSTPEVAATSPAPSADFARHAEAIKEAIARESVQAATASGEPAAGQDAPPETPARQEPAPYVAAADRAPSIAPSRVPDAPAVTPARGRGGVQAGVAARPEPRDEATNAPGTTMSRPRPDGDDPEKTAAGRPSPAAPDEQSEEKRERIVFGESDDLLADVDTGVNENEFKW